MRVIRYLKTSARYNIVFDGKNIGRACGLCKRVMGMRSRLVPINNRLHLYVDRRCGCVDYNINLPHWRLDHLHRRSQCRSYLVHCRLTGSWACALQLSRYFKLLLSLCSHQAVDMLDTVSSRRGIDKLSSRYLAVLPTKPYPWPSIHTRFLLWHWASGLSDICAARKSHSSLPSSRACSVRAFHNCSTGRSLLACADHWLSC